MAWAGLGFNLGISGSAPSFLIFLPSWVGQFSPHCTIWGFLVFLPYTPAFSSVLRRTLPASVCLGLHAKAIKPCLPPAFLLPTQVSTLDPRHPFLTVYSNCSHEPNPCPPFRNTSPIALTFSHRDKQRPTSPEIDSHRAERHRPCPAPHARAQARRLLWREAHRRGVCQCTHINIHTHSLCAVPQKGADTRCARQGHTHLRAPGSPPSPAHPPRLALGQEQGLLRARAPPRFLPANVSLLGPPGPWGKGLRNAAGATWGKKVGTACSLPGPVGKFPNRETICGEGWVAGEPPVTSRGVPSPCRHR